jgi:hypothetical protein
MSLLFVFRKVPRLILKIEQNIETEKREMEKEEIKTLWLRHLLGQNITPRQGKPASIPVS